MYEREREREPPPIPEAAPPSLDVEAVNWILVVVLLGCLAFWGLVVLGLLMAF